jgi:hypothetical protein
MQTFVSIAVVLTVALAIAVFRRLRRYRPCAHPLRRARGRTRDRNGAAGIALVCAIIATMAHRANATTWSRPVVHVDDGDMPIVLTGSRETKVRHGEIDVPAAVDPRSELADT